LGDGVSVWCVYFGMNCVSRNEEQRCWEWWHIKWQWRNTRTMCPKQNQPNSNRSQCQWNLASCSFRILMEQNCSGSSTNPIPLSRGLPANSTTLYFLPFLFLHPLGGVKTWESDSQGRPPVKLLDIATFFSQTNSPEVSFRRRHRGWIWV
jgi:hypothetical protein